MTEVVNNLAKLVVAAQAEYTAALDAQNKLEAEKTEFERQVAYHQANNDQTNAQVVAAKLTNTYANLAAAQNATKLAKTKLDDITAQFNTAKANLSPAEQKQAQTALDIQLATVKANEKSMFAQATTKYLIWGTVALVIIVVAIIIYKKKFAK